MTAFVLVHSPVTGPSTWRWVAADLVAQGHRVFVPAVGAVSSWSEFADAVAAQAGQLGDAVLVGHSGAGPLLPQIAARTDAGPLIFVDADIPPDTGEASLMPAEILAELRTNAVDGLLPPWSQWFGPAAMGELVPDAQRRAVITAELPRLPLAYFETTAPVPAGWAAAGGGYILLSAEAYGAQAAAAAARGWPVVRLPGGHLDVATRPEPIAAAIVQIAARLARH
ncbi:MAG: alpha/beta fold hydrolase [Streptosporangiaceae bacterium]